MEQADTLFVYGTLRREVGHAMHGHLRSHAQFLGLGQVGGELYDLGRYPALVIGGTEQGLVTGELYRVIRPAPLFQALDRYEGCSPDQPRPHEYARLVIQGWNGQKPLWAWTYVYCSRPVTGKRILSGDYLQR